MSESNSRSAKECGRGENEWSDIRTSDRLRVPRVPYCLQDMNEKLFPEWKESKKVGGEAG